MEPRREPENFGKAETLLGLLPRELRLLLVEHYLPEAHLVVEAHLGDMTALVSEERKEKSQKMLCNFAAKIGSLSLLQWARTHDCGWNEATCWNAAFGGHLAVLQWVRQNGCPCNENTCAAAAGGGHLVVLQWARQNGCPWDELTCGNAAAAG